MNLSSRPFARKHQFRRSSFNAVPRVRRKIDKNCHLECHIVLGIGEMYPWRSLAYPQVIRFIAVLPRVQRTLVTATVAIELREYWHRVDETEDSKIQEEEGKH